MRRFFVEPRLLQDKTGVITGELFRHMATVLRLKPGDSILLADGAGNEAIATINAVRKESIEVKLEPASPVLKTEGALQITVYQGMPKGDKLELIIQKCTELGVTKIVPFMAARAVPRLAGERLDKKISRWQKIAMEAARQSGRGTVPETGFMESMDEVLRNSNESLKLLLWEGEEKQGLKNVLATSSCTEDIAVIIGPEGGLTKEEADKAITAGYRSVNLGRRILRTETAGLAIVSILQYLWGDLG